MDFIYKYIDKIVENYSNTHRKNLIKTSKVKDYLNQHDEDYIRWAAYGALKNTPLDVGTNPRYSFESPNYDAIPDSWLINLKGGTFSELKIDAISKKQKANIQHIYYYGNDPNTVKNNSDISIGYYRLVENGYHQITDSYLKAKWSKFAITLLVILAIVGFGGHTYLKHNADVKYWAAINSPESFHGDGFTENFPCSQVKTIDDTSSSDLTSNTSTCEYYGGKNHEAIDTYSIQVEHFLSNKYGSPSDEVACGNPMQYSGSADTQVYYNETRQVDGYSVIICGVGQSSLTARILDGTTVYTLSALPSIERNTSSDLDTLIRGFQLN